MIQSNLIKTNKGLSKHTQQNIALHLTIVEKKEEHQRNVGSLFQHSEITVF